MMDAQLLAETSTGLESRHLPNAKLGFLVCQLGRTVVEHRKFPAVSKVTGAFNGKVQLWHLIGIGHDWETATRNAKDALAKEDAK
jgi:hypothetical protein